MVRTSPNPSEEFNYCLEPEDAHPQRDLVSLLREETSSSFPRNTDSFSQASESEIDILSGRGTPSSNQSFNIHQQNSATANNNSEGISDDTIDVINAAQLALNEYTRFPERHQPNHDFSFYFFMLEANIAEMGPAEQLLNNSWDDFFEHQVDNVLNDFNSNRYWETALRKISEHTKTMQVRNLNERMNFPPYLHIENFRAIFMIALIHYLEIPLPATHQYGVQFIDGQIQPVVYFQPNNSVRFQPNTSNLCHQPP